MDEKELEVLPEKQWYVVNTYSGHEKKVAENIKRRIESMNLGDYVFRLVVAEEEIPVYNKDGSQAYKENKKTGEKIPKMKIKNLYPGYIFAEMIMTDESWYMVRNTPGVTGLCGSSGGGAKPVPVTPKEIETVLKRMGMVDNAMYDKYHVGDKVKILHGTWADLEGTIENIDRDSGSVTVKIVFFGRVTPVQVDFSEIIHID